MQNMKGEGMKTSNKILLALGVIPFIVILMMLFSFKGELDKGMEPTIRNTDYSNYHVKTYNFSDFDEIEAEGAWEVSLSGGDRFNIELRAPGDSIDKISVIEAENKLLLKSDKTSFTLYNSPKISITMPAISGLGIKGQCDVKISDFQISELDIGISGIADISGINSSVEKLSLNGSGIVNADLMAMPATNARFNYNGVYMIMMNVDGGELSGSINGPGKLIVSGNISTNTLKTENPDSVTYKPLRVKPYNMNED